MASPRSTDYKSFCIQPPQCGEDASIPLPTSVSYLGDDSTAIVKLENRIAKTWDVVVNRIHGKESFTEGWTRFAQEINLKPSDSLVFTEIGDSTMLVQVYDAQLIEKTVITHSLGGSLVEDVTGTQISFCKYLSHEYDAVSLMIPQKLIWKSVHVRYLRRLKLEYVGGHRAWEVKLERITDDYYLTDGWTEFKTDNCLTKFHMLRFDIQQDIDRWEVSAYDTSAAENRGFRDQWAGIRDLVAEWRRNWKLFVQSRFVREMTQETLTGKLELPKKFAQATGIQATSCVELRLAKEKTGLGSATTQVKSRNNNRLYISMGWHKFARSNKIRIGDVLLFTYIPDSNNVVEVQMLDGTEGRAM